MSRPAPPPAPLAAPLDALLAGDPIPLSEALDALEAWPLAHVQRAWWELSTLYGQVAGPVTVQQGDRRFPEMLAFKPPFITGGPPQRLAEPAALRQAWRALLARPPSRDAHRESARSTFAALQRGAHPLPDAACALLRHHTDLPVDLFAGRPLVDPALGHPADAEIDQLRGQLSALNDPGAFADHLRAGLGSPSLPRRDLAWRLLALSA